MFIKYHIIDIEGNYLRDEWIPESQEAPENGITEPVLPNGMWKPRLVDGAWVETKPQKEIDTELNNSQKEDTITLLKQENDSLKVEIETMKTLHAKQIGSISSDLQGFMDLYFSTDPDSGM